MFFPDIPTIRKTVDDRLARTPNAGKLVLLHAGIPAALSLVLTALSYVLSSGIDGTGGLSGLGTRSLLESLQNMLQLCSMVFSLFWSYGYVRLVLSWTRGAEAEQHQLWAGFRRWGPVLRSLLLQTLVYFAVVFLACQLSSIVFAMSPFSESMMQLVEQMMTDASFVPTQEQLLQAMGAYLPFLLVGMAALVIPVFYRLRLTQYALMDAPELGAIHAMRVSLSLTKGNCLRLLRLDLSYWWFYLLEIAVTVVYYGDLVLQLAGVETGLSAQVLLALSCVLGLALQLGLYVWRKNQVSTAYALVYDCLLPEDARHN